MDHASEIKNFKILILNIFDRRSTESEINITDRLVHPMYARWRGWQISLATCVWDTNTKMWVLI